MAEEHLVDKLVMTDFTEETRDGTGVFDSFMRATKSHIAEEYNKNRITGSDYATVYLSALNATADRALEFLMRKDEQWLRNRALEVELEKAELEKLKLTAEEALIQAQITKIGKEEDKIDKENSILDVQLEIVKQEEIKFRKEVELFLAWGGKKLEAEVNLIQEQVTKVQEETDLLQTQDLKAKYEHQFLLPQQLINLQSENTLLGSQDEKVEKETEVLEKQKSQIVKDTEMRAEELRHLKARFGFIVEELNKLKAEKDLIIKRKELTDKQICTEVAQELMIDATTCKLKAEYNLVLKQKDKIDKEMELLAQRTNTEKAQTNGASIDEDSILGKQRLLYGRQADGYIRDAEQKAAKMMIDTWNVRRTTSDNEAAPFALQNDDITKVVAKLAKGIEVVGLTSDSGQ